MNKQCLQPATDHSVPMISHKRLYKKENVPSSTGSRGEGNWSYISYHRRRLGPTGGRLEDIVPSPERSTQRQKSCRKEEERVFQVLDLGREDPSTNSGNSSGKYTLLPTAGESRVHSFDPMPSSRILLMFVGWKKCLRHSIG